MRTTRLYSIKERRWSHGDSWMRSDKIFAGWSQYSLPANGDLVLFQTVCSPWTYVWWHVQRTRLKHRRDFKLPLEALFSCLGLADVYRIYSNYDLWNEPWWENWYLNCSGCIFISMNHLLFWKKFKPFLLHFQTFLIPYKNPHQN